jgi:hypothetical protein
MKEYAIIWEDMGVIPYFTNTIINIASITEISDSFVTAFA